ncbi:hypothetical protein SAMN05444000_1091, partial [Shimia gijangensis]
LSHVPLLGGYDEPETLPYQITLFGPISADVRQARGRARTEVTEEDSIGVCKFIGD